MGFDVAVDYAPLVGVGEPRRDPRAQPRQPPAPQIPLGVYEALEVPAGNVLHDDVRRVAPVKLGLSGVVDLNDVRVREPGGGAPLALETLGDVGAVEATL